MSLFVILLIKVTIIVIELKELLRHRGLSLGRASMCCNCLTFSILHSVLSLHFHIISPANLTAIHHLFRIFWDLRLTASDDITTL